MIQVTSTSVKPGQPDRVAFRKAVSNQHSAFSQSVLIATPVELLSADC